MAKWWLGRRRWREAGGAGPLHPELGLFIWTQRHLLRRLAMAWRRRHQAQVTRSTWGRPQMCETKLEVGEGGGGEVWFSALFVGLPGASLLHLMQERIAFALFKSVVGYGVQSAFWVGHR